MKDVYSKEKSLIERLKKEVERLKDEKNTLFNFATGEALVILIELFIIIYKFTIE